MSIVNLVKEEKEWQEIHKYASNKFLSVTGFITFIGEGYNSRNSMFDPTFKEKQEKNEYLQYCFRKGHEGEEKVLNYLFLYSMYNTLHVPEGTCFHRDRLLGTVDSYICDIRTGEFGILEVKCPQRRYKNIEEEEEEKDFIFEDDVNKWKHWIQLQLYLWIHEPYTACKFTFGLLAYYFPTGGPNGEEVIELIRINPFEETEERFLIKENLDLFFNDYKKRKVYKAERIKKVQRITKDDIFRGIVQREQLLIPARRSNENTLYSEGQCPSPQ